MGDAIVFERPSNTIESFYRDGVVKVSRLKETQDFKVLSCALPLDSLKTAVMQFGTKDDIAMYVSDNVDVQTKLAVLSRCFTESIDQPLFITMPQPALFVDPYSSLLLVCAQFDGQECPLALCCVVSTPTSQLGNFILQHSTSTPEHNCWVMQVVAKAVACKPMTIEESLEEHADAFDTMYGIDPERRAMLQKVVPHLSKYYHPTAEGIKGSFMRIFASNACTAAYIALQGFGKSLPTAAFYAFCHPGVDKGVQMKLAARLVEPVRIMLLGRIVASFSRASKCLDCKLMIDNLVRGSSKWREWKGAFVCTCAFGCHHAQPKACPFRCSVQRQAIVYYKPRAIGRIYPAYAEGSKGWLTDVKKSSASRHGSGVCAPRCVQPVRSLASFDFALGQWSKHELPGRPDHWLWPQLEVVESNGRDSRHCNQGRQTSSRGDNSQGDDSQRRFQHVDETSTRWFLPYHIMSCEVQVVVR